MNLNYRKTLHEFLSILNTTFAKPGNIYLVGETSLVFEGWRNWTEQIEITSKIKPEDQADFVNKLQLAQDQLEVAVIHESPGDYIPLPVGFQERAIETNYPQPDNANTKKLKLKLFHFDPYSVAFRFIARGDEPDYHLVIAYLQHGWITIEKMESILMDLLPQFTSETIQQDSAEFRRRYKGLLQMWQAVSTGAKHNPKYV